MKLYYGNLQFEANDTLEVEDSAGVLKLVAKKGFHCEKCTFYTICNVMNNRNKMAQMCVETHFEEIK